MNKLKLGIIGLSEGNGHPYSWSAIINGYQPALMASCPFPVIPKYLAKEKFPDATIQDAEVTHIWTQDLKLSHHIAQTTFIPNVVKEMQDMLTEVDAVLLARDDATNHVAMAKPFLEAGLPIYIDKPLALTCREAELLFSLQKYQGQLFTCSAFQYAKELNNLDKMKKMTHVDAYINNHWDKYAIHLIEPILKMIGHEHHIEKAHTLTTAQQKVVSYLFSNRLTVQIKVFTNHQVKPTIAFFNEQGVTRITFKDTFFAFKAALTNFIEGIKEKKEMTKKDFVLKCVQMIEIGNNSVFNGG